MKEATHNLIRRWEPRELSAATIKRKEKEEEKINTKKDDKNE